MCQPISIGPARPALPPLGHPEPDPGNYLKSRKYATKDPRNIRQMTYVGADILTRASRTQLNLVYNKVNNFSKSDFASDFSDVLIDIPFQESYRVHSATQLLGRPLTVITSSPCNQSNKHKSPRNCNGGKDKFYSPPNR